MATKFKIMVVEDEKNAREGIGWFLSDCGYEALLHPEATSALEALQHTDIDILLTDLKMPGMDGMELLERVRADWPDVSAIMISAHGTLETAVDAMKLGAIDFINKPVNLKELRVKIEKALAGKSLLEENVELKRRLDQRFDFSNIIGHSPAMEEVFQLIRQVAKTNTNVLLVGETGVGKELVAGAIHHNSLRAKKPFIKVNCGAMTETLLESELFGHEQGAFTNAVKQRIGRFERADGGLILLDEISETSLDFQVRLLRVLQEGEFERVGGDETLKCDVRVIATTNRDLEALVEEGRFREDLYYRLNVVQIVLPPLRQRQEDIGLLANHFIHEVCQENKRAPITISPRAITLLQNYPWPGNVRELRNVIEAAVVMSSANELTPRSLSERVRRESTPPKSIKLHVGVTLRDAERSLIQATLTETKGNRAKAARILGIGRKTLYRKLEEYGIK